MERKVFDAKNESAEIYRHPDGSLTIEASADYGDSSIGWGTATTTVHMDPKQAREFAIFILTGGE